MEVLQVLDPPAAQPEEGIGQDQAEDRDPLDDLPRVHQRAVAELGAGAGVQEVDRNRGGIDLGQLEGHLDPLARCLAEVEDAADAALQARLPDRVDGADAALVADGRRYLRVVGPRRLDVVVNALDARVGELLRPVGGHVADRDATLEVGVLGDQAGALEDLLEVAPREPLTLRDHAEAVRAGGLGRLRVLEDLIRLHHRVHRGVRLGVARLGAEPAVLGAAARLRVDERAHVGRVAEALGAHLPGALHESRDLLMAGDLGELHRLLEGDQWRHRGALDRGRCPWAGVTGTRKG